MSKLTAVAWEYKHVEGPERRLDDLVKQLNNAGAEGWEAFATTSLKKGIASDTIAILLKRSSEGEASART